MTQTRALQITFVEGYGYGPFPFTSLLHDIAAKRGAKEFTQFQIVSNYGRPRARFEGESGAPHEEVAMHGVLRSESFTGRPLPSTVETINRLQRPVLEVTWPEGVPRVYYPSRYLAHEPLTCRVYEVFKSDCYAICREYLMSKLGIKTLPPVSMENAKEKAELFGRDFLMNMFYELGFQSVLTPAPGDIIVMGEESSAMHMAVMVEGGHILHHFQDRLSTIEPYDGYWKDATAAVLRYIGDK